MRGHVAGWSDLCAGITSGAVVNGLE